MKKRLTNENEYKKAVKALENLLKNNPNSKKIQKIEYLLYDYEQRNIIPFIHGFEEHQASHFPHSPTNSN